MKWLLVYLFKLDVSEQSMLVLYNNHKYRKLFNAILEIEGFETLPIKKVISKINNIKGYSKIKSECFDLVKKRIDDPINASIKNGLFNGFDFTSYDSFLKSVINGLVKLRNVNNKMVLNGDINMYILVNKEKDILKKKFVMVTNDITRLKEEAKENHCMVGITLLKENVPVLYSPYYFDIGDIYTKGGSLQMYIKEMVDFDLLIEISDVNITINDFKTKVTNYYSEPVTIENVQVVNDIKKKYNTIFCKYIFYTGFAVDNAQLPVSTNTPVVAQAPTEQQSVEPPAQIAQPIEQPVEQPVQVAQPMEQPIPVDQPVDSATVSDVENVEKASEPIEDNKEQDVKEETEPKKEGVVTPVEDKTTEKKESPPVEEETNTDSSKEVDDELDKFLSENGGNVAGDTKSATEEKKEEIVKSGDDAKKDSEAEASITDQSVVKAKPEERKEDEKTIVKKDNVSKTVTPSKPTTSVIKKAPEQPKTPVKKVVQTVGSVGKPTKKVIQTVGSVGKPTPVKKVIKKPEGFKSAPVQNKDLNAIDNKEV